MEELYEKVNNLKDVLNDNEIIKEIKKINKKIINDKILLGLIEKFPEVSRAVWIFFCFSFLKSSVTKST